MIEAPFVECGNPSPYKLQLLRDKITKKVTFEKTHGILIHRQKNRRLLNETDVLARVKQLYPHLIWVVFDSLSTDDTAKLFSKAAVIVAPHGAGLTNMIFSPEGTEIIECMPIEQPNACYWHMAEMLQNPYRMIPCHIQNYQCDMFVDIKSI
jgi:capsular polysaccharide biosynthesis protein